MACDPATNPTVSYRICNDSPGVMSIPEADGSTVVLGPGECCFISACVFRRGNLCKWPITYTPICLDEWMAGYMGPEAQSESFVGVGPYTLTNLAVIAGSLAISYTDGAAVAVTMTDDGLGNLTGTNGDTGAVVYSTGLVTIAFGAGLGSAVQIDYQAGGGTPISPEAKGITLDCKVVYDSPGISLAPPPIPAGAAFRNVFKEMVHASIDDVFVVGVGGGQAFTYPVNFANTQWYRIPFNFVAQTIEFDNHSGLNDFYFFIPSVSTPEPLANGAAGASGIVHAGEQKDWDDQQGMSNYIYIQPLVDNVPISAVGNQSFVSAFAA